MAKLTLTSCDRTSRSSSPYRATLRQSVHGSLATTTYVKRMTSMMDKTIFMLMFYLVDRTRYAICVVTQRGR